MPPMAASLSTVFILSHTLPQAQGFTTRGRGEVGVLHSLKHLAQGERASNRRPSGTTINLIDIVF